MEIKGKVWKFGDDINTDEVIPARYLNIADPAELARHCLEGLDPEFAKKVASGDIIVAGKNFGCGSSREHAPIALKAAGVSCVIAESFARIFFRNGINIGLPILEGQEASRRISEGDELRVDLASGIIENLTWQEKYQATRFPEFIQELISAGGLMEWVARYKMRIS